MEVYEASQRIHSFLSTSFTSLLVLAMTLLIQQATTTTTAASTILPSQVQGCILVYTANEAGETFTEPCESITFPCTGDLRNLQKANPDNCARYYVCTARLVYDCPCAGGTQYNTTAGTCIDAFYGNCTCPDGRGYIPQQPGTGGAQPADPTGLIVGLVVGGVVIVVLIIVIIILVRRRQRQRAKPMMPSPYPNKQLSVRSGNYEDINDLKRGEDPNIYDNGPTFQTAIYDNSALDKDAIRAQNDYTPSMRHNPSMTSSQSPPLPGNHPSSISSEKKEEEPEYMETLE